MTKPTKTKGVKFPTTKEMATEFPRLLNQVKYLMAENTAKDKRLRQAEHDIQQLIDCVGDHGEAIISLQGAYISQNCRISNLKQKLNKALGNGSVDYPLPKTEHEKLFGSWEADKTTLSVAGEDGKFKPVEVKHGGLTGWIIGEWKSFDCTVCVWSRITLLLSLASVAGFLMGTGISAMFIALLEGIM